jgi:hypothetical protein
VLLCTNSKEYAVWRFSNATFGWGYARAPYNESNTSIDAVSFEVDAPIVVTGFIVYGGGPANRFETGIFLCEGECMGASQSEWTILGTAVHEYAVTDEIEGFDDSNPYGYSNPDGRAGASELRFDSGIRVSAGQRYTAIINQCAHSCSSFYGNSGKENTVEEETGVTFLWFHSNASQNGTGTGSGNIPGIIFSK